MLPAPVPDARTICCRLVGRSRDLAPALSIPVTNGLERLNGEVKRRTEVVGVVPNTDACRRLVRALAVETHENWLEAHRYLNMNDLREHKKTQLRKAA